MTNDRMTNKDNHVDHEGYEGWHAQVLLSMVRNRLGGTAKRPTGAWGWMVLLTTPKLEDSLGGATRTKTNIVIQ